MKQSFKSLLATCLAATVVLCGTGALRAEIIFGYKHEASYGVSGRQIDFAKKGQFFATTDFADTGFDAGRLLRGRTVDKAGVLPSGSAPWVGDGARTLFGVRFNYPLTPNYAGQFDCFTNQVPLFDHAVIWWGGEAPGINAWSACIETTDGKLVKINPDSSKAIYPSDRTAINFAPTTIKAFYVGLKGREDGLTNFATVRNIQLSILPDQKRTLTNNLVVASDLYQAYFSVSSPGMIDNLTPNTAIRWNGGAETPCRWMTPFIEYNGTNLFPVKKEYQVKTEASKNADLVEYTLSFDVPGSGAVEVAVKAAFRQAADKSVEFEMQAGKLPAGAKLGYRFYGPETVFGALAGASPTLSGQPIAIRTPVGNMAFHLTGADHFSLSRAEGLAKAADWFGNAVKWIKLETVSSGPELKLAISLPIGSAGQPQPETLNYTWRPSLAGDGDDGVAPFKMSDLELLEEIDCGNTNDPHAFYDSTNDPAVEALKKKHGKLKPFSDQDNYYGFLAFLDNPKNGAVPLETIRGERCRAIPDKLGSYFRYDLNTKLKPRTPYLVVVEHAFDTVRRGEFHTISFDEKTGDLVTSRGLYGGFEAEPDPEVGFKTEYELCNFQGLSFPGTRGIIKTKDSIVFSNKIHSGPWQQAPGPAVKRIRIYRVKTMPELPDLAALAPSVGQQRSVTIWTEMDRGANALYLFQYPKLLGYNAVWSHTREFFGGRWWGEPHDWCNPGTLAGNELLFEAAQEQGVSVNIHLGELLHLGFEGTDYDSFTDPITYMGETIPIKPTRAELDHLAGALRNVVPKLAKYRSLRDVSTQFWPWHAFTRRNLDDFCAATGAKLAPSPSTSENVKALLNGGPEVLRQWQQWSCAERFRFNQWLLAELRQYRPDLYITMLRYWDHGSGLVEPCLGLNSGAAVPGASRQKLASAGIKTLVDYLRFLGVDPALYADSPGFALELEAYSVLRTGKEVPDYFETDWFRELKNGFNKGGLGVMIHSATLEASVPLLFYHCPYVVPRTTFRKGLIRAFVFANPRNITIGSYNEPWGARLGDFREFVVPYRLLPFVEPASYDGKLSDTASQVVIKRYGDRHGLVNNGEKGTVVDLELPAGSTAVTDLSDGVPRKLETLKNKDGKLAVKIAMTPWSLKALEMK